MLREGFPRSKALEMLPLLAELTLERHHLEEQQEARLDSSLHLLVEFYSNRPWPGRLVFSSSLPMASGTSQYLPFHYYSHARNPPPLSSQRNASY
jgi:hypothetical protein